MKLTLTISMDNAAFDPSPGQEAARVIRGALKRIERLDTDDTGLSFGLLDINGNNVGSVIVSQ